MIKEHDIIYTKSVIKRHKVNIPKNTKGTVTHIYSNNSTYEVEFKNGLLLTLNKGEINKHPKKSIKTRIESKLVYIIDSILKPIWK